MERHIRLLGALMIAYGILGAIASLVVLAVFVLGASFIPEADLAFLTTGLGIGIANLIAITELPAIAAGWGLLQRKSWARILTLIIAAICLIEIPFGTALGLYAFWVLLEEDTVQVFERRTMQPVA
jgi:hypothetical protein